MILETAGRISKVRQRFNKNYFEEQAWAQNQLVIGLDEVG